MKVKWNGHASFTITAEDGTVLVTDPYDPSGYGGVLTYTVVSDRADAVLVSHDHADHNYVEGLSGSPEVIRSSKEFKGIKIKAVETFHDESNGSERGKNMVFSMSVENIDICFSGDLGHQLSDEQINAIGNVDILMVPVGGTFTLDAEGAAKLTADLKPAIVIPMHYRTAKCNLPVGEVNSFTDIMENVTWLDKSEIELTAEGIPAHGTEVWVMDFAN